MQNDQDSNVPHAFAGPEFVLGGQSFQSDIAALQAFLLANTHTALCISARNLARVDSRLFQYLIAATASWRGRGLTLEIADLPSAITAHFENLGISPEMIIRKSAQ